MNPVQPDVISAGSRPVARWLARAGVVVLAGALAVAIVAAVHYHGQAGSLQRQLSRAHGRGSVVPASLVASSAFGLTVASTDVPLLGSGPLTATVTFFAAYPPGRPRSRSWRASAAGGRIPGAR
jgi:hypothetical protein